jgi:hypothetical protein
LHAELHQIPVVQGSIDRSRVSANNSPAVSLVPEDAALIPLKTLRCSVLWLLMAANRYRPCLSHACAQARRLRRLFFASSSTSCEQRGLAIAIECDQRPPEAVFVLGQLAGPLLMASLDRLGGRAVGNRPRRVRTSNAGQLLFTGIASADRARRLGAVCYGRNSSAVGGIRTVSSEETLPQCEQDSAPQSAPARILG